VPSQHQMSAAQRLPLKSSFSYLIAISKFDFDAKVTKLIKKTKFFFLFLKILPYLCPIFMKNTTKYGFNSDKKGRNSERFEELH
jgi:hypothetical protein